MRKLFLATLFIIYRQFIFAQINPGLLCGPMLCDVEHREAKVWLEVAPTVHEAEIRFYKQSDATHVTTSKQTVSTNYDFIPLHFDLWGLDMNTTYQYDIYLDGKKCTFPFELTFHTKEVWEWRKPAPDFSFLFGSCAYINDAPYDRPGDPYGRDPRIFDSMANNNADFMLWLGDNMYTREADWTSHYGFYYRYTHDRSIPQFQKLLAVRPNLAIWDDHDFGPNDSGDSYILKDISLAAFKDFWDNPTYGEANNPGVYTMYTYSDCDFFLTDNRYYRDDDDMNDSSAEKNYFGAEQLKWLENSLLFSNATFKFIATGSQVMNPLNDYESLLHYQKEFNELLSFIRDNKINGVIFLTGDRHFSEIIKVQPDILYPLYDITSSAFTSKPSGAFAQSKEADNSYRVVPNAVLDQNYMKVSVSGERNNRVATIACYTVDNKVAWQYQIQQTEISFKP